MKTASMTTVNRIYNDTLLRFPDKSAKSIKTLDRRLVEDQCCFGAAPIPCFLKPYFMSKETTHELKQAILHVMRMLEKVVDAFFRYPEFRHLYGLSEEVGRLMKIDPGFHRSILISRPDAFLTPKGFRFIEFNCDSPAGAGYADIQEKIFKKIFPLNQLKNKYQWVGSHRLKSLLETLLDCYRSSGGHRQKPHIAIVDWEGVKTHNEFLIIQTYFREKGFACEIADPRSLRYKKGALWTKRGFRVDLVYRRVIFNELWKKRRQAKDFLNAYRGGRVCMVNPLRSRLAANKAMLSILTDSQYDFLLTQEERRVRDRHIAWTRHIQKNRKPAARNRFKKWIYQNKNDLVLKPADRYGGFGVTLGCEKSRKHWKQTIERAFHSHEAWVVQEYVPIPQMKVPMIQKDKVRMVKKKFNINPFIFNGLFGGAMARLSDESVINVSAGGGLIPAITFSRKGQKR